MRAALLLGIVIVLFGTMPVLADVWVKSAKQPSDYLSEGYKVITIGTITRSVALVKGTKLVVCRSPIKKFSCE